MVEWLKRLGGAMLVAGMFIGGCTLPVLVVGVDEAPTMEEFVY